MEKINDNKLKFIRRLALEFRLSSKNICKILNVEPSDENQKLIYEELCRVAPDYSQIRVLNYLLYETANESEKDSKTALMLVQSALMRLKKAEDSKDQGKIDEALKFINQTDIDFKNLQKAGLSVPMSEEETLIISKYRIKHVFNRTEIAQQLKINRETIRRHENEITNERWAKKIEILNDCFTSERYNRIFRNSRVQK